MCSLHVVYQTAITLFKICSCAGTFDHHQAKLYFLKHLIMSCIIKSLSRDYRLPEKPVTFRVLLNVTNNVCCMS